MLRLQSCTEYTQSGLWRRLYILRTVASWIIVDVIAFCHIEFWPILTRRCYWRSCVSIVWHWFESNWKSAGRFEQRNSTEKSEGNSKMIEKLSARQMIVILPGAGFKADLWLWNFLKSCNFYPDSSTRTWWTAYITLLATSCITINGCPSKST